MALAHFNKDQRDCKKRWNGLDDSDASAHSTVIALSTAAPARVAHKLPEPNSAVCADMQTQTSSPAIPKPSAAERAQNHWFR
jgi:predicted house-cleaning NTP pyrophosphatase (Maf/HAM1 superfamily)